MVQSNSITITVTAAVVPTTLTLSAATTSLVAGGTDVLTATLTDQNGAPIANARVTFNVSYNGSPISGNQAATNSSGQAQVNLSFANAGTYTAYATA